MVTELLHVGLMVCHLQCGAMSFDRWVASLRKSLLPPPFRVDEKEPSNHGTASPELWDA